MATNFTCPNNTNSIPTNQINLNITPCPRLPRHPIPLHTTLTTCNWVRSLTHSATTKSIFDSFYVPFLFPSSPPTHDLWGAFTLFIQQKSTFIVLWSFLLRYFCKSSAVDQREWTDCSTWQERTVIETSTIRAQSHATVWSIKVEFECGFVECLGLVLFWEVCLEVGHNNGIKIAP